MKIRMSTPDDDVHVELEKHGVKGFICEAKGKTAVIAVDDLDQLTKPEVYEVFATIVADELDVPEEAAREAFKQYFAPTKH